MTHDQMTAPRCRMCARPLAKRTVSHYFREPREGRPERFREYPMGGITHRVPEPAVEAKPEGLREKDGLSWNIYTANRPRTKAECACFTNYPITSVSRHHDGETITAFTAWDGESYERRYRYFCTNRCAAEYGQRAATAGFR